MRDSGYFSKVNGCWGTIITGLRVVVVYSRLADGRLVGPFISAGIAPCS